jgi:hypothetical protein
MIVIEHGTRRAHLADITGNPDEAWTTQTATSCWTSANSQLRSSS